MTTFTTVTLLENVVYGTASGNYDGSSLDWVGTAVPAANYYGGQGNLQTIAYRLDNVQARIIIQATLNDLPEQAAWFDVHTFGDSVAVQSGTFYHNINGNFAWLRARVELFESGTIQSVTASY